jgi:hypothetical protein
MYRYKLAFRPAGHRYRYQVSYLLLLLRYYPYCRCLRRSRLLNPTETEPVHGSCLVVYSYYGVRSSLEQLQTTDYLSIKNVQLRSARNEVLIRRCPRPQVRPLILCRTKYAWLESILSVCHFQLVSRAELYLMLRGGHLTVMIQGTIAMFRFRSKIRGLPVRSTYDLNLVFCFASHVRRTTEYGD